MFIMSKKINIFIVLALCVFLTLTQNPKKIPWPSTYSQSYTYTYYDDTVHSPGMLWYNWNIKSMQYDFSNSLGYPLCHNLIHDSESCTLLFRNQKLYVIFPERKSCCYLGQFEVPNPDYVSTYYVYNRTETINGVSSYLWTVNRSEYYKYYTTKEANQVPVQQENGIDKLVFGVGSYTEKITNSNIFVIPSYCSQQHECQPDANLRKKYNLKNMINSLLMKGKNFFETQ